MLSQASARLLSSSGLTLNVRQCEVLAVPDAQKKMFVTFLLTPKWDIWISQRTKNEISRWRGEQTELMWNSCCDPDTDATASEVRVQIYACACSPVHSTHRWDRTWPAPVQPELQQSPSRSRRWSRGFYFDKVFDILTSNTCTGKQVEVCRWSSGRPSVGINTETHKHAMDTADHMTSAVYRITNQISITVMSSRYRQTSWWWLTNRT